MGRTFSSEYIQKILAEVDDALARGERGSILRASAEYVERHLGAILMVEIPIKRRSKG